MPNRRVVTTEQGLNFDSACAENLFQQTESCGCFITSDLNHYHYLCGIWTERTKERWNYVIKQSGRCGKRCKTLVTLQNLQLTPPCS
jgi:molybdopterin-guanine dinucleotide biosynthesis protein A